MTPGPTPAAHDPSLPRRSLARAAGFAAPLLLGLWLFSPAREVSGVGLDVSNYASYAYFIAHGVQVGADVVPMAGPYGFVPYGFLYAGHLFTERLLLELLTKVALGILLWWSFRRAGPGPARWAWLGLLLVMVPLVDDLPYDFAILFAGLFLLDAFGRPERRGAIVAVSVWLALLFLFKGTQTLLACCTLVLVTAVAVATRRFRLLPWILGPFAAGVIGWLLLAGQSPANLPGYLRGVLELSSGYNEAMALEETRPVFLAGAAAFGLLELLIGAVFWPRRREPAAVATALLLAGFTFVQWKHGFVRADGHVFIFYSYACVAAPLVLMLGAGSHPGRTARRGLAALAGAVVLLGLWGDGRNLAIRYGWLLEQLPRRIAASASQLARPVAAKARLHAELELRRDHYLLPGVQSSVGRAPVDFFGVSHGFLPLNRLSYRPRPMGGGSFNVFTPGLQELNRRHVADPARRPDYFLLDLQTVDDRFAAQDDAGTLVALLHGYEPIATEQGMVLLRARAAPNPPAGPRLLETRPLRFDDTVVPPAVAPGEMLLVSFSLPPSLTGRLRAFLYKPPLVFLDLDGAGLLHPRDRRVVPPMFRHPVILDPILETTDDVIGLLAGHGGKPPGAFRLRSRLPGCFATEHLTVSFHAMPRPAATPRAAGLRASLRYPVFDRPPARLEPPASPLRRLDGLFVQMLEPPGRVTFPLSGTENEAVIRYGVDPAAWSRGHGDGVEFLVEVERPGMPAQLLFRRWLRPVMELADRPIQTQRLVLPPLVPGSTLTVRTGPGADGDGGWDWSFLAGVRFIGDGFSLAQFPGFNVVPVAVEALNSGALDVEGRRLFMFNPPGLMEFRLNGTERRLEFSAGLLPGAYEVEDRSDGVEFFVETEEPGGTRTLLLHRGLDPRHRPEDRGSVRIAADLPPLPAGTRLFLRVGPGPAGSASWDWSYLESLRLE